MNIWPMGILKQKEPQLIYTNIYIIYIARTESSMLNSIDGEITSSGR